MTFYVEADSAAVGQLRMATSAHQLASVGVGLTREEQLGDTALQGIDLGALISIGIVRDCGQLSDIALDPLGKLDLDLRSGFVAHGLPDVDAQLVERTGTVLGALSRATSNALGSKSLDLIVGLPIMKDRNLALHLAHLLFEVAQLLEELPGFGPWQKWHQEAEYSRRPLYSPVFAILAGYVPVDQLENSLVEITAANPSDTRSGRRRREAVSFATWE